MSKNILQSNTTRAVAGATAVGGGGVMGLLAWLRSLGALPWGEDQDAAVAVVITTFVVPVLSRLIKRAIDAIKGGKPKGGYTFLPLLLCVLIPLAGCITTTHPDGSVTRQADIAATIAITEQTLHLMESSYAMYLEQAERGNAIEAARAEARAAEQAERMAALRELLVTLYAQQQAAEAAE